MNTETGHALEVTRVIKATPAQVFRAWTTPEQMKQWSCPEGATVIEATADARVGGSYTITMQVEPDRVVTASGTYREFEPPSRLVYTWQWENTEHDAGETVVTVVFNDLDGATEVVLRHDLFPSAEARDGHEQGWGSCLNRLELVFA